jgi:lysophospholipase L1-like esterase
MLRPLPMSVRPSNTGPTSPAKQSLVANLALLGGGIVVALLFAEVALRIYNPLPMPLRGNNQVLPKSVVLQREVPYPKDGKLLERFEVRTNQLGFRGPELPEPREGRPTIFFVGGSTTEGRYIPDEHAWPLVATATLAHEFPGLWGNNAGLEGNSSHGHKLLLEHVILPLRPRFVVFLVGVNEIWVTDPQEFDGQTAKGLLWKKLEFSELLSTLTVLYRSMRARDAGLVSFDGLNLPQRTSQVIDPAGIDKALAAHRDRGAPRAYEQRLRDLLAMTRAAGAEPILLTQPALFGSGVDPTTGLELGPLVAEGTWNPTGTGEYAALRWAVLELYNDVTRAVAADTHTPLVELARELPKDSSYYVDWIHYSNAGSRAVADVVARGLRPILREKLGGR